MFAAGFAHVGRLDDDEVAIVTVQALALFRTRFSDTIHADGSLPSILITPIQTQKTHK